MTQTIEQLTARVAELEAENRIERNLRIGVEATFDMLNEEIGRYKAAFEQQKAEIQRWKYSAENPNFKGRLDTWQSVAGKYRAEAEELTAEVQRLKAALTQFLDQEGNPPEDTGEWRFVLQVLGECK